MCKIKITKATQHWFLLVLGREIEKNSASSRPGFESRLGIEAS